MLAQFVLSGGGLTLPVWQRRSSQFLQLIDFDERDGLVLLPGLAPTLVAPSPRTVLCVAAVGHQLVISGYKGLAPPYLERASSILADYGSSSLGGVPVDALRFAIAQTLLHSAVNTGNDSIRLRAARMMITVDATRPEGYMVRVFACCV